MVTTSLDGSMWLLAQSTPHVSLTSSFKEKIMSITKAIVTIIGSIGFLVLLSFLLSWPVYMLWNGCLVGAVDGVREVTWLQAWGINFLFGILFKSNVTTNKD